MKYYLFQIFHYMTAMSTVQTILFCVLTLCGISTWLTIPISLIQRWACKWIAFYLLMKFGIEIQKKREEILRELNGYNSDSN